MTQLIQPASIIWLQQSQQAGIILVAMGSPLVQAIVRPLGMFSHLQVAIISAQVQQGIPFIRQQQVHIAPGLIAHRFCIIETAIASSLVQVIFIPPLIFSIFMVQRGIIMPGDIMPMPDTMLDMGIGIPIPGIIFMPGIIALIIPPSLVIVAMFVSFPSSALRAFSAPQRTRNCSTHWP